MSAPFVLSLIVLLLASAVFKTSLSGLLHTQSCRSTKVFILPLAVSIGMFTLTIDGLTSSGMYSNNIKAAAWAVLDIAALLFMLHAVGSYETRRKTDTAQG